MNSWLRVGVAATILGGLSSYLSADQIDSIVKRTMADQHVPGLTLAIVEKGKVISVRAYGLGNLEDQTVARRDSVYEIGSMTKQFTAACVLLLAQDGKLSLDDKFSKYLHDLPKDWSDLTIRRVLSHTAGLKDYLPSFDQTSSRSVRLDEIVDKMGKMALDFKPGESWSYSNTDYALASMLVERISGDRIGVFMKQRIFDPLGMSHTRPSDPDVVIPNRAKGYAWNGKEWRNTLPINPSLASGAGFLVSTVDDLAKWDAALESDRLFQAPARESFFKPVPLDSGRTCGYSLGWFVSTFQAQRVVEHGGNTYGFSSEIFRVPSRHVSIIVLTNEGMIEPKSLCWRLLGAVKPAFSVEAMRQADPDPSRTARLMLAFRDLSRGKRDLSAFSPTMRKMLGTLRGAGEKIGLANLGKEARYCRYLGSENVDGVQHARYAFVMKGWSLYTDVTWTTDGLIDGFDSYYGA